MPPAQCFVLVALSECISEGALRELFAGSIPAEFRLPEADGGLWRRSQPLLEASFTRRLMYSSEVS